MAAGTLRVRILGDSAPLERSLKGAGKTLAGFAAAAATAMAGFAVFSVKKFGDFDEAMNSSVAIMGDVSDKLRGEMSDAAREVAKTTAFSAEEAAESYFFLASAGMDAAESIEALPQVAAFAQAGNFDMARATDLLTDSQSALGLTSDDAAESLDNMARVGDVLVKANTLANASVEEFATALTRKAGNALQTLGKDVEEGTAALAVFADQGIKGEKAGTLLTNTLQGLTDNARDNEEAFDRLGVSVFDSEGNMNNLADIAGDLEGAFEGMSVEQQQAELASLGFNKQAREGILALMGNSEALEEYEGQLREAGGTADEVAGKQMETFNKQLGLLKDQFFDVALSVGEQLMPHIMRFVELLQDNMPAIQAFIENALETMGRVIRERVVPAFQAFSAWWQENGPAIIERVQAMWAGVKTAFDALASWWETNGPAIMERVQALWDGLTTAFEAIGEVWNTVVGMFQSGGDDTNELWQKMLGIATTVWDAISSAVTGAVEVISGIIEWFVGVAETVWDRWGESMMETASRIWDAIQRVIGGVLDVIQGLLDLFIGAFTGDWRRAWEGIRSIGEGIWDIIAGAFEGIMAWLGQILEVGLDLIEDLWESAWTWVAEKAAEILADVISTVSSGIDDVVQFFRDLPGTIQGMVSDAGQWLVEAGKNIITGLIDGIKSMISRVRDTITDVASTVRDALPFSPAKYGPLSGSGAPDLAGQKIAAMLASGMDAEARQLAAAAERMAARTLPDLGVPRVASRAGQARHAAQAQPVPSSSPVQPPRQTEVRVFIGDRELTDMIDVRVEERETGQARSVRRMSRASG